MNGLKECMKKRLLDFLCCPNCGRDFECKATKKSRGEFFEGTLKCRCGASFKIVNGIPRIVLNVGEVKEKIAESFAYEWKSFPELAGTYKEQFLGFLGPHVKPSFFKNKLVLDAGCGMGRHAYWAAKWGAEVIAFDLGTCVDIAAKNTQNLNVHIVQADIYNLPFKRQFDFVYCIGVLHHLPDGQKGFKSLLKVIKPDGAIFAWVYGKEGNKLLPFMLAARKITTKMPLPILRGLSFLAMLIIHPFVKIVGSRIRKDSFFHYLSKFGFRENHAILFDQLLAPIANYYTKKEFKKWFKNAGLKPQISWRNQNSWRGFAKIPEIEIPNQFLEPELKPEYVEKINRIKKGKYIQFGSVDELRKATFG
jgi:2-polyprenyl-3-methyl-5-hydroxy-6-metoxy-1,4-benzoquinol methylase